MFFTLILQYLNKLVERKIGDFTTPQPFHTVKVQRLGHDDIKPSAQVGCNFVVPVLANVTLPFTMLVKREPTFVEFQGFRRGVPRFERESDASFFKEVCRLELRRTIAIFTLELWKSTESIKKPFVSDMDTDNHCVKRITGYPRPVWIRAFEQLRQMRLQAIPASVFPIDAVISLFQLQKVVMHIRSVFFQKKRCGLAHEGGLSSHYLKVGVSSPFFR